MNPLNYASLEASKRLVSAGIVLKTDFYWVICSPFDSIPYEKPCLVKADRVTKEFIGIVYIPDPSMAEVWRELPPGTELHKHHSYSDALHFTDSGNADAEYPPCNSVNPTDALIDLLIWITGQKKPSPASLPKEEKIVKSEARDHTMHPMGQGWCGGMKARSGERQRGH